MGRKRSWKVALGCGALLALFSAVALFAYSTFQDNLGTIQAPDPVIPRWNTLPVDWLMNSSRPKDNVDTSTCTIDASSCIQQSLAAGFTTWTSATVRGQSLTDVSTQYVTPPANLPTAPATDCQNVIGFSDTTAGDFSTGAIAFTAVAFVDASGQTGPTYSYQVCGKTFSSSLPAVIVDADIEFNPSENFSTSTTPSANTFSLQSVATHEEGHLLGLDHSGIGHTVMFPFGDTTASGQTLDLSTDDAIGISFLYPSSNFSTATGKISGTVSLNSTGTFAAHVVAINATTGNVVLDGLTRPDGTYTLVGVPPGSYHILALPLAADVNSGILVLDDFSGWDCGYGTPTTCSTVPENPTNYTGRYH